MGDHTAYYRTALGEEEIAFVRLARRLADQCEDSTWRDARSFLYGGRRQKGVKSAKRRRDESRERRSLSNILNVDIDSLTESDFAQRIKTLGAKEPNSFQFDARVAPGHEVGGYLLLNLETETPYQHDEGYRLSMDFRLGCTNIDESEFDPNSLDSRALSLAFVCGASVDKRPISEIQACIVAHEGILAEEGHVFSQYLNSLRAVVPQLRSYQAQNATVEIDSEQKKADLQILDLMSDRELLKWYLETVNHLPGSRARKGGKGLLTSTTDSSGMSLLYAALLKSLE